MKKLFLVLAAGMMAATVNAQNTAITSNKAGDNWYFGINAGVGFTAGFDNNGHFKNTKFKGIAPNAGLRIGKNLTTVFGLAAEASVYGLANEKSDLNSKTFINATNISLLGTVSLCNLFSGYPGEPRVFGLIALGGFGWMHQYGNTFDKVNALTSKVALDFAFNLGADKAWQLYVEPNIVYALDGWANGVNANHGMKYNFNDAVLGINLGLNYKFGNSNGSHNFVKAQLRDQAEIDGLNAKINELRADNDAKSGQLSAKDQQIADLQKKLADCEARPVQIVENVKKETVLQPIVIFRQGKSTIEPAQYASVEMVAKYMRNHPEAKVLVRGYASPEGDAELNQRLSVARAEAVKTALINRYKIAADRITTEGLGATDKLSEEIDFNRVAMFVDTTK